MAYLEARHRLHARMEDRIKGAKECGLANFPCSSFQAIRVWLLLVQMAQDLLAWARRLCLLFLEAVSAALPAAACGRAAGAQRQAEHPAARRPLGLGG
jgi:hypothetical protein